MKKIYVALFTSLLISSAAEAQLTQTNHAPAAGENYQMYHCDSVNVAPGGPGASQTWDFSAVTTYSNLLESFSVQATGSSGTYSNANVAVFSSPNRTGYYNSASAHLQYYGGNITVGPIVSNLTYTVPAITAAYPMSLNTTSTAPVAGSITVTAPITANGTFSGTSAVTADGTGTVIVGGVTYSNAIRVRVSSSFNFTTSLANGMIEQVQYDYYAAGVKPPVFSLVTFTASIPFSSQTQTTVVRLKAAPPTPTVDTTGVDENAAAIAALVFPNPAVDQLSIRIQDAGEFVLYISDFSGKQVKTLDITNGAVDVPVSDLSKGIYLYEIRNAGNRTVNSGKFALLQ